VNDSEANSRPRRRRSDTARMDTSEESLSRAMNSLPMGGRMTLTACGMMIWDMAWAWVMPRERAASICPLGMDWIPARKISPMYAP